MITTRSEAIITEIIRNGLVAITDEMKNNLMRTAYNMVIYEALDYTVGLFDADGRTVSIGLGLPMFIQGLSDSVKAKIAHYGKDRIYPGDVLLTNDAQVHGCHLNHIVVTQPIFWEDEIVAFASTMAHWRDVGGVISGITTDIFQEGLQMPIVKICKQGELDEELVEIIKINNRLPDLAMGDLRAQIAAAETGNRRFTQLLQRNGRDAVLESIRRIMDHSEAEARRAVETIPDGVYEAESFMDDDGVSVGVPIPLKVKVIVEGDQMTIDLTEVSRQVRGYFNSGITAGRSASQAAFKCLTSPMTFPINDGSFRPLKLILPMGRLVSATKPAAMRCWMNPPQSIVDTIFKALAPAIPNRVIAGHYADLFPTLNYGVDPRNGRFFIDSLGLPGGGWGAKHNEDGMCATICFNDGDTHNSPVESVEAKYPILFETYGLRQDSGGPGKFRGGMGVIQVRRALTEIVFSSQTDRTKCAPWGLFGGKPALANKITLRLQSEDGEREFPNAKVPPTKLNPGDAYILRTGGGGGYGDPTERPAEVVHRDVVRGYVSMEQAYRDYGVVVEPETMALDGAATARRRAEIRLERDGKEG